MNDENYQGAVDMEADRLMRLTPCELMQLTSGITSVQFNGQTVEVYLSVLDLGSERHVGVLAQRNFVVGHRKFARGIRVKLESSDMTPSEVVDLYD